MFCIPPSFLAYICTVAVKNIRNMYAVSTNQIADILHFNDNSKYHHSICFCIRKFYFYVKNETIREGKLFLSFIKRIYVKIHTLK